MTEEKQNKIKVYGAKVCPYCVSLKEYLDEKGFKFEYIDVGEDEKEAKYIIEKSGQRGIPVSEIDGEIIIGFDKVKIDKLLGIKE